MNIKTYAEAPAEGQPSARQAKQIAHQNGLSDLTLNRKGLWVAFDYSTGDQVYITDKGLVRA